MNAKDIALTHIQKERVLRDLRMKEARQASALQVTRDQIQLWEQIEIKK